MIIECLQWTFGVAWTRLEYWWISKVFDLSNSVPNWNLTPNSSLKSYTLHFQSMRSTFCKVWFDHCFRTNYSVRLVPSKNLKPIFKKVEQFVNSEVSKNNLKNLTFHVNCQFSLTFLKITHQFWHVFQQKIATCCLSSHFSKTASLSFGFFGAAAGASSALSRCCSPYCLALIFSAWGSLFCEQLQRLLLSCCWVFG